MAKKVKKLNRKNLSGAQKRKGGFRHIHQDDISDEGAVHNPAASKKMKTLQNDLEQFRAEQEEEGELYGGVSEEDAEEQGANEGETKAATGASGDGAEGETPNEGPDVDATESKHPDDPYLMEDAKYIVKDTRWRNKQRTLIVASSGTQARIRHLQEDLKKLLPHHKPEQKMDKTSNNLLLLNEICELKNCSNCIFLESRKKGKNVYMHVSRVPSGPWLKFQVKNVHTSGEIRLAGNCLLGSRPILHFDEAFEKITHLRLVKEMFTQVFGTPRNHPKSKPFHDHIMCFYWIEGSIAFRHYQIAPETADYFDNPEHQHLTEIGPRFILEPIRFLAGSFCGKTMFYNKNYLSPVQLKSVTQSILKRSKMKKLKQQQKGASLRDFKVPEDEAMKTFA